MQINQQKKMEKQTQETIKEIFENKKATRSGEYGYGEYQGQEKLEKINEYTQKIYDRFVFRYGSIGTFSQEEFKSKIIDCLNNQELLNEL
jgi:bisphosphoglycerate-dependent phosphoglycerate mutase